MQVGDTIEGKYELIKLLGEGGMGVVYEAQHTKIGRRVALKFLHQRVSGHSEALPRFLREAKAAAAIGSEHIVDITDVGETDQGEPYLVMEYLDGVDLSSVIMREAPLDIERAVSYILQAGQGLTAAHERGIVHRDLKPENLFLTSREDANEWIKILDFGLAKFRDAIDENPRLTKTGCVMGSPFYMSAEQALGTAHVDHRTDIYSLGVILYELLTGKLPFSASSVNELVVAIITAAPKPPREHKKDIPEALEEIILRALAAERDDRYQTIVEFSRELLPFCPQQAALLHSQPTAPDLPSRDVLEDMALQQTVSQLETVGGAPQSAADRAEPAEGRGEQGAAPEKKTSRARALVVVAAIAIAMLTAALTFMVARGIDAEGSSDGALVVVQTTSTANNEPAEAEGTDRDAAAASPASKTARLEISLLPSSAQLSIDGAVASKAPYIGQFPRDGRTVRVKAWATGYEDHAQFVIMDQDQNLVVSLRPKAVKNEPQTPGDAGAGSAKATKGPGQKGKSSLGIAEGVRALEMDNPYKGVTQQ